MNFRSAFLAFGVFSLSGFTAGADESLNTCNIDIEGATVLMSAEEIATEWSSRGYVRTPPPSSSPRRERRSYSRVAPPAPDPDKSVSFQTADGLPNDRFASFLSWADRTPLGLDDAQPHYVLYKRYQPPADTAGLEAYIQILRDEITSWCEWATPILEGQEDRDRRRVPQQLCGEVLAGEFRFTTGNGIPQYPFNRSVTQTWNGCNWTINSLSDGGAGGLGVTISGPANLAK